MPHKHKRRQDNKAFFDLPPTAPRAQPLPTSKFSKDNAPRSKSKLKRKREGGDDDTPKSFARLMRFHTGEAKLPKGLDDGIRKPKEKKRKRDEECNWHGGGNGNGKEKATATKDVDASKLATATTKKEKLAEKEAQPSPVLKILPGERLGDFAARVDQALPLSNLASLNNKKNGKPLDPAIKGLVKERPTKHNKRLARMQKEWREEEARRKDKREEAEEEDEEKREEEGLLWDGVGNRHEGRKGKKNKKKHTSTMSGLQGEDDDPWAELTRQKREKTKQRSLQDVVQAPPVLDVSKARGKGRIFRDVVVDVENVPASVGSLRKREEMAGVRRGVIDGMRERRGKNGGGPAWE